MNKTCRIQFYSSKKYFQLVLIVLVFVAFYFRMNPFFPNVHGALGHDYSLFLPSLLDGVYWFKTNGISEVPWFTPSFGGGLPKFPNPQSMYYSVPQWICFLTDPLSSVRISIMLFGFLGFLGFYILLSKVFKTDSWVAILGSTLFLFNNFYFVRMLIGHLGYHSFMLMPLLAFFLIYKINSGIKKHVLFGILGALIIAYVIYSGGFHLLPIMILASVVILVLYLLINDREPFAPYIYRFFIVVFLGLLFSASILNASISYIGLFSRDFYPLPGYANSNIIMIIFLMTLFVRVPVDIVNSYYENTFMPFGMHEFDYGITIIPLLLMLIGLVYFFRYKYRNFFSFRNVILCLLLWGFLAIPFFLNYYSPSWNNVLKSIPFICSSSTLIRWISVYIPFVIVFAMLGVSHGIKHGRKIVPLVVSCIFLVVVISKFSVNEQYYANQHYKPHSIIKGYNEIQKGEIKPEIKTIALESFADGEWITSNDIFVTGASQIRPYEPIFGYLLEQFPQKTLHAGDALSLNESGTLNVKNPVSYVFPKENHLSPGDHFTSAQYNDALKFTQYKPFDFRFSVRQIIANYLTLFSLLGVVLYFLVQVVVFCFSLLTSLPGAKTRD